MSITSNTPNRKRNKTVSRANPQVQQRTFAAQVKRLVYRTPHDVIAEIGLRDAAGRLVEREIYTCRHHWILLLRALLIPIGFILVFGILAYYRGGMGGDFLTMQGAEPGQFDPVNRLLLLGVVGIGLLFFFIGRSKQRNLQQFLIGSSVVLVALFYFRYRGGRLLYTDQALAPEQAFDTVNQVAIGIVIVALLAALYIWLDWLNDFLILTDQRVIYDDEQLFVRRTQDQVTIDDIQNVVARTGENNLGGYIQHHLNFGTLVIQSASFRQDIVFHFAHDPKTMQKRIMDEVKKLQAHRTREDFEKIVLKIAGPSLVPPAAPANPAGPSSTPILLGRILPANPERKSDGTITWRPHWIFAVAGLARPVGVMLLGLLLLVILFRLEVIPMNWISLLSLVIILGVLAFWTWWQLEDYGDDQYILTTSQVIDIEKVPWGPEDRRTASLGALQNVQLNTTFFGRIIGYGNVEMETAGGKASNKFTFHRVPQPHEVVAMINKYRADFRRGEKERALNDNIALLKAYHDYLLQQSAAAQQSAATQQNP